MAVIFILILMVMLSWQVTNWASLAPFLLRGQTRLLFMIFLSKGNPWAPTVSSAEEGVKHEEKALARSHQVTIHTATGIVTTGSKKDALWCSYMPGRPSLCVCAP